MKHFTPVAPARILKELLRRNADEPLRQAAFFLAHDVAENASEYTEDCLRNAFSILDNSVIELGGAVDLDLVKTAAHVVDPNVVVLPDVLEDGIATTQAVLESYDAWERYFGNYYFPERKKAELMFVPQGKHLTDWIRCLENVMAKTSSHPAWIGIPRNTVGRIVDSRKTLVDIVRMRFPKVRIHLLGFSDYMHDDLLTAKFAHVNSIDSAVPMRIPEKFNLAVAPGKRGDWWESGHYSPLIGENYDIVYEMINQKV